MWGPSVCLQGPWPWTSPRPPGGPKRSKHRSKQAYVFTLRASASKPTSSQAPASLLAPRTAPRPLSVCLSARAARGRGPHLNDSADLKRRRVPEEYPVRACRPRPRRRRLSLLPARRVGRAGAGRRCRRFCRPEVGGGAIAWVLGVYAFYRSASNRLGSRGKSLTFQAHHSAPRTSAAGPARRRRLRDRGAARRSRAGQAGTGRRSGSRAGLTAWRKCLPLPPLFSLFSRPLSLSCQAAEPDFQPGGLEKQWANERAAPSLTMRNSERAGGGGRRRL